MFTCSKTREKSTGLERFLLEAVLCPMPGFKFSKYEDNRFGNSIQQGTVNKMWTGEIVHALVGMQGLLAFYGGRFDHQ